MALKKIIGDQGCLWIKKLQYYRFVLDASLQKKNSKWAITFGSYYTFEVFEFRGGSLYIFLDLVRNLLFLKQLIVTLLTHGSLYVTTL